MRGFRELSAQPRRDTIDGIEVEYVRFLAPPRWRSYASWYRYARRPLARALDRAGEFDLIHAHYVLPAGGAVAGRGLPLVVSVHGGDVLAPEYQTPAARSAISGVLRGADAVLCNSGATLERAARLAGDGANMRVVHLGASAPESLPPKHATPTVATLAHVIPRKRHTDVLAAIERLPDVRWVVIGDGPELPALRAAAPADRVDFAGLLAPDAALQELARCHAMALPSVDEAFGVAYVEALACGVPAIGCAGEGGPEEIAALGGGMLLVPPRDPAALAAAIEAALADPALPAAARANAADHGAREETSRLSGTACGRATVAAYEDGRRASEAGRAARHRHRLRLPPRAVPPARRGGAGRGRGAGVGGTLAARPLPADRVGPLPRGDRRPRRQGRAARGLPRRAPRRHPVRPVGVALGAPEDARARRVLPADAVDLPRRRRRRHLRPARQRLRRADAARAATSSSPPRPSTRRTSGARSATTSAQAAERRLGDGFRLLFAGRLVREKGIDVLLEAWRIADVPGTLSFAGEGPIAVPNGLGKVARDDLPALYAAADALVLPSIPTATFKEPWGLVVNEAMHQGTPVITSDAVGAAAGGLVVDGRNGHVVPHGDANALATRIRALALNPETRARLGDQAREDARPYTFDAWQRGMSEALAAACRKEPLC